MTPFGHAAVSYAAGRASPRMSVKAVVAGGLLLDVDFLLSPWSFFDAIHRVWTHNILFLALVAAAAAMLSGRERWRVGASVVLGGVLHLFFDAIIDTNPGNGIGVSVFFPFTSRHFSPFLLPLPEMTTTTTGGWLHPVAQLKAMSSIILWEVPFYLLALLLYLFQFMTFSNSRKSCCKTTKIKHVVCL
jgi:membrane-bound metal-dependent hydrolase YbcI (DUF457 family)